LIYSIVEFNLPYTTFNWSVLLTLV